MNREGIIQQIQQLALPIVDSLGLELVQVEFKGEGKYKYLRIYIDREEGVGVEDCQRVSEELSPALDVADIIPGSYRLEVSTPGPHRPLQRPRDFERFRGEPVVVRVRAPDGRICVQRGILTGSDDEGLVIAEGATVNRIAYRAVESARLDL